MGILDVDKLLGQEPDPLAAAAVNLTQAAGQNPQEHIERRKLSNASGVPAALMDDPEVRERARRDAFARELYLKEHPATAGFAANPNNAPLITDDIVNLKDFEDKTRTLAGTACDIGLTALKGVIAMPQAFVGLADIPTGGQISKALEYLGYKPGEAQDILGELYSPAQKEANLKVESAEGVVDTAVAAVQNPSVIGQTILESLPSMLGGAGLARGGMAGAAKLAPKLATKLSPMRAAALGEGAISAGGAAEQIRGENEDGLLTLNQAAAALASGGTTAAFSILGGWAAGKLGIADVDVLLTGKGASAGTKKALGRRVLEGMAAEGILEELPQSATEQMWQNTATGKPLFQGVDQALVLGAFAGMAMGGGSNIVTRTAKAEQENTALLDTLTAAEASRLKAGLPESFAEFAQRAGDQHGLPAIHLQADKAVEVALGQGLTVEQIMPWLEQYGATAEALDTAIQTGGTIALDYGKVAAGFSNDPTLQALKDDFMVSPSSVSKAMAAEAEQVEEAHLEKLNDLFTKEQDLKIGQEDVQAWTDALLATPGLNGRVTPESLSLLTARANALTALTGKPAIEHLNKMLGQTGLTTMKLKDFRELYGSAGEEIGQPQELGQEEFKVKPPRRLYRGVSESGEGTGLYSLGKGRYSTQSRAFAKKFGSKVAEISVEEAYPRNPLVLHSVAGGAYSALLDHAIRSGAVTNAREFTAAYPDPAAYVRSLGFDGVIAGDEIVRYPAGEEVASDIAKTPLPEGATTIEVDGVERPALNSEGHPIHPTVEGVKNFWRWFGDSKVVDSEGRPLVVYHGSPTPEGITEFSPGGKQGSRLSGDAYGVASYFTSSPGEASIYARDEGAVLPVYVRGEILDVDSKLSEAQSDRVSRLASEVMLPSDKARFAIGREVRSFDDVRDARDFFDAQRKNWEAFGDGMDRAKPEARADGGEYQVEFTNFDADVRIETGEDAFTLFKAIGFDNIVAAGFDGLMFARDGGAKWVVMQRPETNVKSAIGNRGTFDPAAPSILMQSDRPFDGPEVAKTPLPEGATTIEVDGVERPTLNSEGRPIHPTVEGVVNFWRWFGDSKVVDSEGRPLVVYHGTDAEFDAFDTSDRSMNLSARNPLGENIGSFFASKERDAKRFGPRVGKYYVGLKNPRVFKTQNDFRAFMRENSGMTPDVRDAEGFIISEGRFENNTRKAIESAGHDGVVILNPQYSTKKDKPWVVAFGPTQIKSATGNRGTFDPAAPSILMQQSASAAGATTAAEVAEAQRMWAEMGTESPYFKKWSDDAPLVSRSDAEAYEFKTGEKVVVEALHGTSEALNTFDLARAGKNQPGRLKKERAFFFTSSEDDARFYANYASPGATKETSLGEIIPVYLAFKNPKVVDFSEYEEPVEYNSVLMSDLIQEAQNEGHDGLIIRGMTENLDGEESLADQYVAFSPTQIKSATGNRGTFDPAAPSILMQSAWHGSPHTFDKFSTSAIGTGEGAQAYGYGLYFAGSKEVAEYYRDKEQSIGYRITMKDGRVDVANRTTSDGSDPGSYLIAHDGDLDAAIASAKKASGFLRTKVLARLEWWKENASSVEPFGKKGRLYKVELAPEEDEYLLWDKPLSEQSEKVRKALTDLVLSKYTKPAEALYRRIGKTYSEAEIRSNVLGAVGSEIYRSLSREGSDKAASEYLHSLGIRGIKYLDGTSRANGEGNYNYVIFSDDDVAITEMFQAQTNDPLGVLVVMGDRNLVNLFEKAEKSTFLHETAHIFLNDLKFVAETLGVQTTEWETAKTWLGIGEDGVITRAQHERFAEHFEVYLKNGEAPVPELRLAFRAFKRWLTDIYDNIKSPRYGQRAGITISPEIANLFDHLLATDQEIRAAREQAALVALLDDEMLRDLDASPAQVAEYQNLSTQADDVAREKRDIHKLKDREELRKEWRKQAEAESFDQPVYGFIRAISKLGGINKQSVIDAFGAENLPDHSTLWRAKGGDINVAIAEHGAEFGYQAPADFVEQLRNLKPRSVWVEQRIAQLETLHDNAQDTQEVIRSTAMRRMLDIESVMLSKKTPGAQAIPAAAIKVWAAKTIAGRTIKQISMGLAPLQAQSRRLRQMAILAVRDGRWEDALRFNEQARRTEGLISASMRASKEWTKTKARWKRIAKWTNDNKNVKLGTAFRDQINRLLDQYEIASREYDAAAPDLHSFVALRATGNPLESDGVVLAEWLGVQIGPHAGMSWERLQDLDDALKFLYGNGREELEGQRTAKGELVKEIAGSVADSMKALKPKRELWSDATAAGRAARAVQQKYRKFMAHTGILRFICQRMDGYAKHGLAQQQNQEIINGMARENDLWASFSARLEPLITRLTKDGDKVFTDLQRPAAFIEHGVNLQWTKKRVVCACLNMGNASNLQRLRDGFALSDAELHALAGKLTAAEWQDIQAIWDTINEMWPMIADVHERINYFRPKKIEPQRLRIGTADGQSVSLAGGYYPVGYDAGLLGNYDLARWSERDDILNSHENTLQVPVAKSGMTKARADKVARPLNLSFDVLGKHLHDSIRYIALAEAVRDTDRIFNNRELRAAAYDTIGSDLYGMIRPTLMQILRPNQTELGRYEWLRTKTSVFYMAWNTWTAIQNITGVFPAMFHAGVGNYVSGMAHVASEPYQAYKTMLEMSGYMRLRAGNMERDMQSQLKQLASGGLTWKEVEEKFADAGFLGIRAIDTLVSLPAWWGVYNDQMSQHGDVQSAIEAADTAINKALGSGLAIDQTGIGRSMWRLLAPFMSFASTQQEVLRTEKEALMQGKITAAEYLHACLMVWIFPAMASTFLSGLMMYGLIGAVGGGDDDDKRKKTVGDYFTDVISYRLMGLPFVRDAWNAYLQGFEHKQPITAARMPFTEFFKLGQQAFYRLGALDGDSEKSQKALAWTLAEMVSYASGLPVTRAYDRWRKGQEDIENREGWWMNHLVPQERKK